MNCSGCGWSLAGGRSACQSRYEEALARDYADQRYFAVHRLLVDCYSLQHPVEYCSSGKSLAAHLGGLCIALEDPSADSEGFAKLRNWLDGSRKIDKPELPLQRGELTLGDLPWSGTPADWARSLHCWAAAVWTAYSPLHPLARSWLEEAGHAVPR